MTQVPTPSAWRYEHSRRVSGKFMYQYAERLPNGCDPLFYVPMFTMGQLNQYGQACFEEGREARAMVEPMDEVAHRFAHSLALELECVLADRPGYYDRAMQLIGEYRSAMNAIHEQHSPTHMREPLLHNAESSTPQGVTRTPG